MAARLETLQAKKKQIDAKIQAIKAREAKHDRERDTRRKIVLGGAIMRLAADGKIDNQIIVEAKKAMTERDRAMFSEWIPGSDWTPNKETMEAMQEVREGRTTPTTIEEMMSVTDEAQNADSGGG